MRRKSHDSWRADEFCTRSHFSANLRQYRALNKYQRYSRREQKRAFTRIRMAQEAKIFRAFSSPIARTYRRSSGATEQDVTWSLNLFLNCPQKEQWLYVPWTGYSHNFISTYKRTYSLSSPAQPNYSKAIQYTYFPLRRRDAVVHCGVDLASWIITVFKLVH